MANPWTGEVALMLDGQRQVLKLTLGALAELETTLAVGSLVELVERFEGGTFSTLDVICLLRAGLRGGGIEGIDPATAEISGGPMAAARVAAELLARAFMTPDQA
ncbi:MAG: gene transfer agent family protein [Paracoccaceae bacterium]